MNSAKQTHSLPVCGCHYPFIEFNRLPVLYSFNFFIVFFFSNIKNINVHKLFLEKIIIEQEESFIHLCK